ncbi:hypothetical protein BBJ28_00002572, partial [Nothophytophthora sp. Chile5]
GWRFVRSRPDRSMPLESGFLAMTEKAIGEDIKLEEIQRFFPDDPSKKPSLSSQQKSRHETPSTSEFAPPSKKKRGGGAGGSQGPGTGQRPSYRRNDYDAPPSPEVPAPAGAETSPTAPDKSPALRHTNSFEHETALKTDSAPAEEEEAGELTDSSALLTSALSG